jgi:geranylgeranyl diphosphate synthase, type II
VQTADELRERVERGVEELVFDPDLGTLQQPMRYALAGGGKRLRPVLCLATAEALGVDAEQALPAALAIELVHTFSMVHDDLPALDDDGERRGRPTVHVEFGEASAVLVGDALLTEGFRLALTYDTPDVARELASMTLGMIGGQELDLTGGAELSTLHALKTGRLFEASIVCGLYVAAVPEAEQQPWRQFAQELGLLFQVVDDILDGDGFVAERGIDGARTLADEVSAHTRSRLAELDADTSVLGEIAAFVAARAI